MANPSEKDRASTDEQLHDLIAEYHDRVDQGGALEPAEFTAEHPELAAELSRYFENVATLESLAGPTASQLQNDPTATVITGETHDGGHTETMIENSSSGDAARISKDAPLTQFGRYRIRKELGRGAMGAVYLAHDEQLDREVALKIPKFETDTNEELLERFYREARAAAALQHPGICPVHDVGELDGQHYITMAFIKGRPLRDFTKSSKRQKGKQVARVIRKVAMAMAEAHEHNVVHRDLKPANIMINERNEPVVMDFGLARRSAEGEEQLTHTGTVIGTPAYMSPEQVDGDNEHVGPHSDIYSLGVIFYEMLTGQLPFQGNLMSILKQIALTEPQPPVEIHDDIDPSLQAICLKMMAKKSEDRPASMSDVARDLTMWLQGRQVVADESEPLETSQVPGLAIEPDEPTAPIMDDPVAATVIREPEATLSRQQQESGAGVPPGKRKLMITGGLAGAALLLAGIVFFVRLGKVNVQITLDHPSLALKVDDGAVVIEGSGKPIRLSAGPHALLVEKDGLLAKTDEFVVRKDGVNSIHVTVIGDEVFILKNGEALPPGIAGTSQGRSRGTRPEMPSDFSAVAALNSPEWEWSAPLPLPESINTDDFEASPAFSADGRTLYFTRDDERRGTATTRVLMSMQDGDLKWSNPQPAHDSIQRIKGLQEPHIVASSKSLFFNSEVLPGGVGSNDLFFCKWDDGKARWTAPENLGPTINYRIQDQAPTLTADGLLLLFCSDRPGGPGGMDLWMSERTSSNAMWSRPIPLKAPVNSTATESRPCLSPDGLTLLFTRRDSTHTSMRTMWVSTRTDRTAEWQAPVRFTFPTAPNMSMASPAISPDGTTLVFVAHHGDSRKSDIWMSRRVRKSSLPTPPAVPEAPPLAVAPFDADQAMAHQQAWADFLGLPVEKEVELPGGEKMKFMLIPPGEFMMGSTEEEIAKSLETAENAYQKGLVPNEGPQHRVVITRPFWMSRFEITLGQFRGFVNATGYKTEAERDGKGGFRWLDGKQIQDPQFVWSGDIGVTQTDDSPVVNVSWNDAMTFCEWISAAQNEEFTLPTEAQWEYTCRAGTTTVWYSGNDSSDVKHYAWTDRGRSESSQPVGQLLPNAFGLHDMHGSVAEWCADRYGADYYATSPTADPTGPESGFIRPARGGGRTSSTRWARSAFRNGFPATYRGGITGFRPVIAIDVPAGTAISVPPLDANGVPASAIAPFDADQAKAHQQAWADYLGEPVETTNSIGMKLALIPPSKHTLRAIPVELKQSFRLGVHELTQQQWQAVMGTQPWVGQMNIRVGADNAAAQISWLDATEFCRKLTERERKAGLISAKEQYRLPTEAEWEIACRAGTTTNWSFGDDESRLGDYAWYEVNSKNVSEQYPHEVGLKKPNPWGLHDIHGNVWEWCQDESSLVPSYGPFQIIDSPADDSRRVNRGGAVSGDAARCQSSMRFSFLAKVRRSDLGFRVVLSRSADNSPTSDPSTVSMTNTLPADTTSRSSREIPPLAVAPFDAEQAKAHQQAWADHLGLSVEKEVELPGGEKLTMVLIPPGEFLMGSTKEELEKALEEARKREDQHSVRRIPQESPQHRVRITKPFYLGRTEVTQAQWQSVMGDQPSRYKNGLSCPVEKVSWNDIQPFLEKLNAGDSADRVNFVLPTEAQWEYACRAGVITPYHFGQNSDDLSEYGWSIVNSDTTTHAVGTLKANAFGLFDTLGNVWEWCADRMTYDVYYARSVVNDPTGAIGGSLRVVRGGGISSQPGSCRSAHRNSFSPEERLDVIGVRLAASIDTNNQNQPTAPSVTSAKPTSEEPDLAWQAPEQLSKFQLRKSAPDGLIGTMSGHTRFIQRVAFSPDGKRILSSSWNSKLRLHDVETGQELKFKNTKNPPGAFAVDSAFNSVLTFGARDNPAILWDMESGLVKQQFPGKGQVSWVALSQGGKLAAVARPSGVSVWNAESGTLLHPELGKHTTGTRFVDFSADGKKIVTTAGDTMNVFDVQSGKRLSTATLGPVAVARFTTDGKKLVGGGNDATLYVWDETTLAPIAQLSGHTDKICSLALTASGRHAVTGSPDRTIRVWDLQEQKQVHEFDARTYNSVHVAISPDGRHVVSGGGAVPPMGVPADSDYRLHLWKLPKLDGL